MGYSFLKNELLQNSASMEIITENGGCGAGGAEKEQWGVPPSLFPLLLAAWTQKSH